ncbi:MULTISPECIES: hypothetical protein [Corynebacterium]|nr:MULTISPECIES: hypothetical protein [Corynebacterium]
MRRSLRGGAWARRRGVLCAGGRRGGGIGRAARLWVGLAVWT